MKKIIAFLAAIIIAMATPAVAGTNGSTWTVYPSVSLANPFPLWPYFTPQMYDASCGQSAHDCTTGLTSCINAAFKTNTLYATCFLPPGTYTITSAIPWGCANVIGTDPSGSTVSMSASFVGSYGLDMNCTNGGQHEYRNIALRNDALGSGTTTTIIGSSSTHHAQGSAASHWSNVAFISASTSTFAISIVNGGGAEQWWITGTVWDNVSINAPCPINIGVGDDIVFHSLRMDQLAGCTTTPIEFGGTDTVLLSTFIAIGNLNGTGAGTALISLTNNVRLDGIFMEGTTNADWFFQLASSSLGVPQINRLETNATTTSVTGNQALIRVNVPTSAATAYGIAINNYSITSGSLPVATLFSIFNSSTSSGIGPLNLYVTGEGFEQWAGNFAKMGSGGNSNTNNVIQFHGDFNGNAGIYNAHAPASGNAPAWTFVAPATSGITPSGTTTF